MPVRTAYAPVAGAVLTATNLAKLPGGWIGYAEQTAVQTSITTLGDLTNLTVAVTVGTGRRIRISGFVSLAQSTTAGLAEVDIYEGATQLQRAYTPIQTTAGQNFAILMPQVVLTPTSGAHTYNLKVATSAGSAVTNSSATTPSFILVEDIGATP